jgi:SPP1 family predicted phage head-tail adaptor
MLEAGRLSNYIALEEPVKALDAFGGEVLAWRKVKDVWAYMKPTTAREAAAIPQMQGIAAYTYTIREFEGVNPSWRIVHNGRILEIKGVLRLLNGAMQIIAEEKV